jgi:hypothetical protein
MSERVTRRETKLPSLTGRTTGLRPHWQLERLAVVTYDGKGFEGFLGRIGTSEKTILRGLRDGGEERERALSCYQEWLIFGVLGEWRDVCPDVFDVEELVQRTNEREGESISFRGLVHLMKRFCVVHVQDGLPEEGISGREEGSETYTNIWPSILHGLDNSNSRRTFRDKEAHLTSITTQAFDAAYRLHDLIAAHWKENVDSILELYPQMPIAIEIVLETIRVIQNLLQGTAKAPIPRAGFPLNVMYIRWRMRKDGWCPSRIESVLAQPRGSGSVNYLHSLMPSCDSRDHSGCSIVSCALVTAVSSTEDINDVPAEELFSAMQLRNVKTVELILAKDSFPIIKSKPYTWTERLSRKSHARWPFELVTYQQDMPYVAISHVWYVPTSLSLNSL